MDSKMSLVVKKQEQLIAKMDTMDRNMKLVGTLYPIHLFSNCAYIALKSKFFNVNDSYFIQGRSKNHILSKSTEFPDDCLD
jgi:hypothetical protein